MFWFGLVESDRDPERIVAMIDYASAASPRLSWAQSNHDRVRTVTPYGGGQAALAGDARPHGAAARAHVA